MGKDVLRGPGRQGRGRSGRRRRSAAKNASPVASNASSPEVVVTVAPVVEQPADLEVGEMNRAPSAERRDEQGVAAPAAPLRAGGHSSEAVAPPRAPVSRRGWYPVCNA
jgi:hypothetical protein